MVRFSELQMDTSCIHTYTYISHIYFNIFTIDDYTRQFRITQYIQIKKKFYLQYRNEISLDGYFEVSHWTVAIFRFPFVSQLETRLYYLLIPRFGLFSPDCGHVCIYSILNVTMNYRGRLMTKNSRRIT